MVMYRYLILLIIPLLGCNNQKNKVNHDTITVSIRPQKFILQQIAGDRFKVNVLVPDGSGPETYEPTAVQMKEISRSRLCFITGLLDFEKSWIPKVAEMYPELPIINTSQGINLIKGHEKHHSEAHHHGVDPHIWLSLKAVKIQGQTMLKSLISVDSPNKSYYTKNYLRFVTQLESVDSLIRTKYLKFGQPVSFMIYHPSLSYYAMDYGVEQIPIEVEGKEPSPAYMKDIIDLAAKKKIQTVFYSAQFDKRSAETVAKQLNISLTSFNPLEENVEQNLLNITDKIIDSKSK